MNPGHAKAAIMSAALPPGALSNPLFDRGVGTGDLVGRTAVGNAARRHSRPLRSELWRRQRPGRPAYGARRVLTPRPKRPRVAATADRNGSWPRPGCAIFRARVPGVEGPLLLLGIFTPGGLSARIAAAAMAATAPAG
jgi:hypothetical protein